MGNVPQCCCVDDLGREIEAPRTGMAVPGLSQTAPTIFDTPDEKVKVSASSGLKLGFKLPDDSLREVVFASRPFGMMFCSSTPITVTEVQPTSHALELGIEVGWVLLSIEGEDVTAFSADAVRVLLRGRSKSLPHVRRT